MCVCIGDNDKLTGGMMRDLFSHKAQVLLVCPRYRPFFTGFLKSHTHSLDVL